MKKKSKSKNLFEIFPSEANAAGAPGIKAQPVDDLFSLDSESFELAPPVAAAEPEEPSWAEPVSEPSLPAEPEPEPEAEPADLTVDDPEPEAQEAEPAVEDHEPEAREDELTVEPEPELPALPPSEPDVEPASPTPPVAEVIVNANGLASRIAYVNGLSAASNQSKLVEIAVTDPQIEVCKAALKRLTTREVIMQVASAYRKRLQGATGASKAMYEELFRFLCENCIRKITSN
ncbi:MAG: hypothetical protein LBC81_04540 [Tannerellaceae bacterium]|jgi:hypothetical protein|nr:hypothetical protein [Tannerellaceae bacterium]